MGIVDVYDTNDKWRNAINKTTNKFTNKNIKINIFL